MINNHTKWAFLALALVFAISCKKSENLTFSDWDKNNSSLIEMREFVNVFEEQFYNDLNTKDNKYWDDEDFYQVVYNVWDADGDSLLSEEEWTLAFNTRAGNYAIVGYDLADENADGRIIYDEYYKVVDEDGFTKNWSLLDGNKVIEEELAAILFKRWDINNNGVIDELEYDDFDLYYSEI